MEVKYDDNMCTLQSLPCEVCQQLLDLISLVWDEGLGGVERLDCKLELISLGLGR